MCGGSMQLKRTQSETHVPGNPQPTTARSTEWVCPDCDYFEEADEERT